MSRESRNRKEREIRRDSFSANLSPTKGNSCSAREFASLHGIEEDEREIESESADADVFSNAREAKTNNAKANILANFDGDDLSSHPARILIRRPGM